MNRRDMYIFPQKIPFKVMDGKQLTMVLETLLQNILVENHDVPYDGRGPLVLTMA